MQKAPSNLFVGVFCLQPHRNIDNIVMSRFHLLALISVHTFSKLFNEYLRKYDILPTLLIKISSHICDINLNSNYEKNSP